MRNGQWWDRFWHVTTGCTKVSPACDHCWATSFAWCKCHHPNTKISGLYRGVALDARTWTGQVLFNSKQLEKPASWKQPQRVFVSPVGDLFHPAVPYDSIQRVYAAMRRYPQHTFIVVTKRPDRAVLFMEEMEKITRLELRRAHVPVTFARWSLPNVWHLATVENQEMADLRIPELLRLRHYGDWPVLGVSVEPMLGPIELGSWVSIRGDAHYRDSSPGDNWHAVIPGIDWVICGGESGKGARPLYPEWARSLRDQCTGAGVPFFFKQWGEFLTLPDAAVIGIQIPIVDALNANTIGGGFVRVGKRRSGRLLDGQEWLEIPEVHR